MTSATPLVFLPFKHLFRGVPKLGLGEPFVVLRSISDESDLEDRYSSSIASFAGRFFDDLLHFKFFHEVKIFSF